MSTVPPFREPVRVSPLIRVGRWTFLGLGILYGLSRQRTLSKRENAFREQETKEKPVKDAVKAAEKNRLYREEMLYLAKETGTPVPANF